ncbi:hypothetical protein [Streptomyces sp. NPDC089919]|uniref:hypothetical protein n=1 Tax=Streptomyces sp. NPDC089919 TaxID=3155188 RepID=UPI00341C8E6E
MITSLLTSFLRGGSLAQRAAAVTLLAGPPALLAAALAARPVGFGCALVLVCLAERFLEQVRGRQLAVLRKARLGLGVRALLRHLLAVLLAVRAGCPTSVVVSAATLSAALPAAQSAHEVMARVLRERARTPVVVRDGEDRVPDPGADLGGACRRIDRAGLPALAGLTLAASTGTALPAYAGIALSALEAALCLARTARRVARSSPACRTTAMEDTNRWLAARAPTVVLYFSGSKRSGYQVDMWLRAVERLDEPAVVLLRERAVLERLAPTSLPVLCVPAAVDVMALDLSSVRVGLYVSNVGRNIHLLRVPTLKHAFVGHGDSDKAASSNPYAKVYDEVWVAGPAGRERYRSADVGVEDHRVVEIGRPQLAGVRCDAPGGPDALTTVLYAPTWEGWADGPGGIPLVVAGEAVVRRLLAMEPPVRVLYRPHPLTGTRSKRAAEAHRRVAALLAASDPDTAEPDRRSAHRVVTGPDAPDLYACFNEAHALVSDISSVVPDFLASGKPYAVVDVTAGVDATTFADVTAADAAPADTLRARHVTASAGYSVLPDGRGLEELVAAVRDPGADRLAGARRRLRTHLFGTAGGDPQDRFGAAVRRLAEQAERRNRRQEGRPSPAPAPGPAGHAPSDCTPLPGPDHRTSPTS